MELGWITPEDLLKNAPLSPWHLPQSRPPAWPVVRRPYKGMMPVKLTHAESLPTQARSRATTRAALPAPPMAGFPIRAYLLSRVTGSPANEPNSFFPVSGPCSLSSAMGFRAYSSIVFLISFCHVHILRRFSYSYFMFANRSNWSSRKKFRPSMQRRREKSRPYQAAAD